MLSDGAMLLPNEFSLACRHCGNATLLEMSFIRKSRFFTCRHCHGKSPIDRERVVDSLERLEELWSEA